MEEKNQPRRPRRSPEEPLQKNESLVYGKNPVTELLKSGSGVDTVLIAEGMAPAVAAYYTALAKEAGATVKRVHPNKLRLMTGTESHQGVAAFASDRIRDGRRPDGSSQGQGRGTFSGAERWH